MTEQILNVMKPGSSSVTTLNFPKIVSSSQVSNSKCKCGGNIIQTTGYDQVHSIDFTELKCNKCGKTNYVIN